MVPGMNDSFIVTDSPCARAVCGTIANAQAAATRVSESRIFARIAEALTRKRRTPQHTSVRPTDRHPNRTRALAQRPRRNTVKFSKECVLRASVHPSMAAFLGRPRMTVRSEEASLRAFLVLPMGDEVVDHSGVGERRGVAETAGLVFGDLAQDAAHDFSRARLRQVRRKLDEIGRGDRSDLLAHPRGKFLAQIFGRLFAGHQRDIGIDALALD